VARFAWKGSDERGDARSGELEAAGVLEAADALRAQGMSVTVLERAEPAAAAPPLRDLDAFVFFNESLARLTGMGMALPRAVHEIASGLRRGRFRDSLDRLEGRLKEGKSLEEAAGELEGDFPPYYRWMVRAGAQSGNLPGVLSIVSRNAEGFRRARRALVSSLAYPAVVLGFAAVFVVVFTMLYVPLFEDMYRHFELPAPPAVHALARIARSPALAAGGLAVLLLAGAALFGWLGASVSGERALLRLPLVGRIRRNLMLARFAGTLGILLRAKAPLSEALPLALGAAGSRGLDAASASLSARAAEGAGLEAALKDAPVVTEALAAYLALAERSGRVPEAADELASLLADQAAAESETLHLVLLPSAVVAAGVVLGTLIVSVVVPYFRFLETLASR
jgi:general secretion pathway protein F